MALHLGDLSSESEKHAARVKATWDTVALFLPCDYARTKGKVEPYVSRRLRHIVSACVSTNTNNKGPTSILDVGCGDGAIIDFLDDHGMYAYKGLDVSSEMIDLGRKRHPQHDLMEGSFPNSLSKDESFDVIVFNGSLQFFQDTRQALMDASARLKPAKGSRIVLSHVEGARFVQEECRTSGGVAVRGMPNRSSLEGYANELSMRVVYKEELLVDTQYDEKLDGDDDKFYLVVLERI